MLLQKILSHRAPHVEMETHHLAAIITRYTLLDASQTPTLAVSSNPSAFITEIVVFNVGLPLWLNER